MRRGDAGETEILQQAPQPPLGLVEVYVVAERVEPRNLDSRLAWIQLRRVHIERHRFVAPVEALENPPEVGVREQAEIPAARGRKRQLAHAVDGERDLDQPVWPDERLRGGARETVAIVQRDGEDARIVFEARLR